ncbi:alanine racemase [Cellulomonas soli]|uniref:Alanine racemase n=1 Tax=Cellulomonas soli TaxID=931535 RepID=A0A512PEY3_9CELL|nr:alanine racemase [Cellulomonas soli]NYI59472.1 D-serine deaminase-like pyridoxal phosphate-dependent protein [Cellulomonas soli]GEP69736.1 alanine racemase [Cellulomonas soli]
MTLGAGLGKQGAGLGRPGAGLGARLDAATKGLPAPLAVLDLDALDANAVDLVRRAAGTPVRLASKSLRVRHVLTQVLARPGFAGVMAYSVREALWLVGHGVHDVLVGYPSVDTEALDALAADPVAAAGITLMVDDVAQVDLLAQAAARHGTDGAHGARGARLQVCLDVDASLHLRVGPWSAHLGVRRSPVHSPREAAELAGRIAERDGVHVRGVMFYEAQVAGMPDSDLLVRAVKRASVADLDRRRRLVVDAVQDTLGHPLTLVNSGGSGSLESSAGDPVVTEVTAGSGLYVPTLFDHYRSFAPRPAAYFGLDVVRVPAPGYATVFGGGYVASGPATRSRLPRPVAPDGLLLTGREGAGEVQTPLRTRGQDLRVGDRVWFRHAKAGEQMERFDTVHLVRGDRVETSVPTYRGEGRTFG